MHLTPAGLPSGIPGIGDEIDAAMQQAPQPGLHSISKGILAQWFRGSAVQGLMGSETHGLRDSASIFKDIKKFSSVPLSLCAVEPLRLFLTFTKPTPKNNSYAN